jgi:hypothetical protein
MELLSKCKYTLLYAAFFYNFKLKKMNFSFLISIFLSFSLITNAQPKKIIGTWSEKVMFNEVTIKLKFRKDSNVIQTTTDKDGTDTYTAKYYFKNDSILIINWGDNLIQNTSIKFIGMNKMKISYWDIKEQDLFHSEIYTKEK